MTELPNDGVEIDQLPGDDEAFAKSILAILDETALGLGRPFQQQAMSLRARDDQGKLVGGLVAYVIQGWLFVKFLAVVPAARKSGIGVRLLDQAEMEARRLGLVGIYLDTFDFQAPAFYLRQGYEEIGRLPAIGDVPLRFWFAKRFERGEEAR